MEEFYNCNLSKAQQDVRDFYFRNKHLFPKYVNGDIPVTVDGAYAHIGFHSRFGVTFICEFITGRILDFNILEKCFECTEPHHMDAKSTCPKGLHHGCSGSMEVSNAKNIFMRSKKYGFRYITYVSDADSRC